MSFFVGSGCINCKHTDCVDVCPADCFLEAPNFLVIHPDKCIKCNMCETVCPERAIFEIGRHPESEAVFININRALATSSTLRPIFDKVPPMAMHKRWSGVPGKIAHMNPVYRRASDNPEAIIPPGLRGSRPADKVTKT